MDPRIECVAGFKPSAEQQRKLGAFVKEAGPALLQLRVFPSLDTTSSDDLPTGLLAIMDPSARVNVSLISDQLFEGLAAVRVPTHPDLKEKQLRKNALAQLQSAVQQTPAKEVRFAGDVRSRKNTDLKAWAPELGGPKAFLGVYSQLKEDHRSKDYWIVARSTVPAYVADVKGDIVKGAPTYRDLMQGDEWTSLLSFGAHGADRNLGRLLANGAEACGVEITRRDEICAFLKDANHMPPEIAVPDVEQHTHAIQTVAFRGKPAVALSYGVVFANETFSDKLFLVANPFDGIIGFPISDYASVESAMGLPTDTGRKMDAASLPLGAAHYEGRTEGVLWEGGAATHPDLHADAFNSVSTPAFREAMTQLGWNASDREDRLVPLAVKIWA
jgi:hypothetical protein